MRYALTALMVILAFTAESFGYTSYIGYSGAPGSRGACAVSCHYRQHYAPSVTITGFPANYIPGQNYEIQIARTGGAAIRQFNGSTRIGTGSANGGLITAGTGTATYNHSQETNGIRWQSSSTSSGSFFWEAPASGTGEVRLYLAGLQGTLSNGASFDTVLVSTELVSSVENTRSLPGDFELSQNYPNPFNGSTQIDINFERAGDYTFGIMDITGKLIYSKQLTVDFPGRTTIRWNPVDSSGEAVSSGIYFYSIGDINGSQTRKMIYLK
jgi:hypothetical protein